MKRNALNAGLRTRVAELATKDPQFRKALVANPTDTIRANFQLPAGEKLRVVEADLSATCIVVPHRPKNWPSNISESDALMRLQKAMTPNASKLPEISKKVLGIIAKAMTDSAYATNLSNDPVSTLRSAGIDTPNGVTVSVFLEAPGESIVIVPSEPPPVTIDDSELDDTAILLQDSMAQTRMSDGSWPFSCSNPPTWCPSCQK